MEFETIPVVLFIGLHQERIILDIMPSLTFPLIIGLYWLKSHNSMVDWKVKTIKFSRCDYSSSNV